LSYWIARIFLLQRVGVDRQLMLCSRSDAALEELR
jgi:hypothetical protein